MKLRDCYAVGWFSVNCYAVCVDLSWCTDTNIDGRQRSTFNSLQWYFSLPAVWTSKSNLAVPITVQMVRYILCLCLYWMWYVAFLWWTTPRLTTVFSCNVGHIEIIGERSVWYHLCIVYSREKLQLFMFHYGTYYQHLMLCQYRRSICVLSRLKCDTSIHGERCINIEVCKLNMCSIVITTSN
jgi:hypothetical protein